MRKKKRLRISPKRAASLNAAAGLLMLVFAMPVLMGSSSGLDLAAGGFDRRARALGHRHALERHRPRKRTREHHLGGDAQGRGGEPGGGRERTRLDSRH